MSSEAKTYVIIALSFIIFLLVLFLGVGPYIDHLKATKGTVPDWIYFIMFGLSIFGIASFNLIFSNNKKSGTKK